VKTLRTIGNLIYKWWMRFARVLAFVNTMVILTIFFVLIIGPIAIVLKIARVDFLQRKFDSSLSYWKSRENAEHTLENAARQY
jgi:hypothetical protein